MLLTFSVTNFKSFWKRTEFSMAKTRPMDHGSHVITLPQGSYLRTAAIFGANASGKSNFYQALRYSVGKVRTANIERKTFPFFKMNLESPSTPTEFEFEFSTEGKVYWYGFAILDGRIHSEALSEIDRYGKEIKLFVRSLGNYEFTPAIGDELERTNFSNLSKIVTKFNLFLTEHISRETSLRAVVEWFTKTIVFLDDRELQKSLDHIRHNASTDDLTWMSEQVRAADVGISMIEIQDKSAEIDKLFKPGQASETMYKHFLAQYQRRVTLRHSMGGTGVEFDLGEESEGTQKFLKLLPMFLPKYHNKVFLADEFEASLHPNLTQFFIRNFLTNSRSRGSQLIFTTHETSLIDTKILRRDEIWFAQKDIDHSSRIFSLAEYKPRNDVSLEKNYLQGLYEGVPVLDESIMDETISPEGD
jgi:uncharacterized protein